MGSGISPLEAVLEQLSDSDRDNLRRVANDLGIEPTDALWSVLAALEYYRKLYEQMPEAIDEAVRASLGEIKATADAEVAASRARLEGALTAAVATAARAVVTTTERRILTQWLVGGALAASVVCALVFWVGLHVGRESGRGAALDANAASNWASTPSGVEAFRFFKSGELAHLVGCDRPGWIVVGKVCYPQQRKGRVYGWRVE